MRRLANASRPDGFDAFARGLPRAAIRRWPNALLRLLSAGRPVSAATLARAVDRTR